VVLGGGVAVVWRGGGVQLLLLCCHYISSSLGDLQLALSTGTSSGVYSHAGHVLGAVLANLAELCW